MNNTRRRKQYEKKHVTFEDGIAPDRSMKFNPRELVLQHKFKFVFVALLFFLIYLLFAPAPIFPKEVQHWHDSGYTFKFREFVIHFQDIPRITKPVSTTPVLLILHGFPTSSYDWKDLVPKLQQKYARIIIPDLLGFGFSDKPRGHDYSIMEQASMVEELMVHLQIPDVHVLAHDYGDTVLQELLAKTNDPTYHLMFNIKSVCLTNGGIIPSQHNPILIQKLLTLPILRSVLPHLTNRFIFSSRFNSVFAPDRQPTSKRLEDIWSIILYKRGHVATPAILKYIEERHTNERRWIGALQDTSVPLHLIYGPLDPINRPEGFLKNFKELVPTSTVSVLQHIGHYPQLEDPKNFMKEYNKFLKRVVDDYYVL